MYNVNAEEFRRLAREMGEYQLLLGGRILNATRKAAADIQRDAKLAAPVDTGNLRNSISTTVRGTGRSQSITAEIGPTANYGAFVEFGTSTQGPQAYLGPAYDRHVDRFENALGMIAGGL